MKIDAFKRKDKEKLIKNRLMRFFNQFGESSNSLELTLLFQDLPAFF